MNEFYLWDGYFLNLSTTKVTVRGEDFVNVLCEYVPMVCLWLYYETKFNYWKWFYNHNFDFIG